MMYVAHMSTGSLKLVLLLSRCRCPGLNPCRCRIYYGRCCCDYCSIIIKVVVAVAVTIIIVIEIVVVVSVFILIVILH